MEKFEEEFLQLVKICSPYTMVSIERLYATWQAVRYVESANISGALVECGVWRGGNLMMMAGAVAQVTQPNRYREIWGYDTFEGMPPPSEEDRAIDDTLASDLLETQPRSEHQANVWCVAPYKVVEDAIQNVSYPRERFKLIQGRIESTIPRHIPRKIAVLRLDTDWYESTWHELTYLFPLLEPGGVLMVDDYGHWKGAKKAVDEYFYGEGPRILLSRIDYTGRMGVKAL